MFEFLNDNTRDLVQFKLQDRIVHVFSEASRVYRFKSICDEAASASWTNSEEVQLKVKINLHTVTYLITAL
jgi:hypothetical protein